MKRKIILWILIPIFSTLYQVFIKLTANKMEGVEFGLAWLVKASSIQWMWLALISEVASFIIWMKILCDHNLSKAFPLSAISYTLILLTSWLVFNEEILLLQIIGSIFILTGVWFIGTAEKTKKEVKL